MTTTGSRQWTMRLLILLAVLAATLGLGVLNAVEASAATKVTDSRSQHFSFSPPPFNDHVCGVSTLFQSTFDFGQFSVVAWDNGHVLVSFVMRDHIANAATGELIARTTATHVEIEGVGSLPLVVEHNVAATCTKASGKPGHEITIVFGLTINEHGDLTELHLRQVAA